MAIRACRGGWDVGIRKIIRERRSCMIGIGVLIAVFNFVIAITVILANS